MKKLLLLILCGAGSLATFAQPCAPNSNSLFFNGSSSYVSVTNQTGFDITDSITIEAWVNASQFGITSAQNSIVCKHGWSQGEAGYVLRLGGSGELSFNFAGLDINGVPVSWVDNISSTGSLTTATWYHVAATFDGNQSKIYVNGVLKGTTPFTGSIVPSPSYPLNIGHLSDPGQPAARFFSGFIDELKIWHRALPQAEIQAWYEYTDGYIGCTCRLGIILAHEQWYRNNSYRSVRNRKCRYCKWHYLEYYRTV